jgi:hypothetical protein
VAEVGEVSNETLVPIIGGEFLDQMRNYHLHKKSFTPWV